MMSGYYFTEDVRRALAGAREEAYRLGHLYVGTEHIALGVLRTPSPVAASMLKSADQPALVAEIERRSVSGHNAASNAPDLPYTSGAKRILGLAMHECQELGHEAVDVEHLLLALLREEHGIAGQALRGAGLDLGAARIEVAGEGRRHSSAHHVSWLTRLLRRALKWAGRVPRG